MALTTSCVTRHTDISQSEQVSEQVAAQKLEQLQAWSLSGKLAIINPNERKSANLAWQQQPKALTMTLTTVVGTTLAQMAYNGDFATLKADGKSWQSSSPSDLIYDVTGWQLPIESLSVWMKGQVEGNLVNEYYVNGLVKEMSAGCPQCMPWLIRYNAYAEFTINDTDYTLPTSIRLEQAQTQTTLILRIDRWKSANE